MNIAYKNFSFENLHKITFYLFLLSAPLQTRVSFLTDITYVTNGFIEYNTKFLYLSDIFLIITFILYIVNSIIHFSNSDKKQNQQVIHSFNTQTISSFSKSPNSNNLNIYFKTLFNKFVNVSREAYLNKSSIFKSPLFWLFLFILWCSITISWSEYKEISIYRTLKLIEFSSLSIYITLNITSIKKIIQSVFILIIAANIQSLIAVGQFITQRSLNLKILGESLIGPDIPGVAKMFINDEKLIRAYGTFPHPNILGGFLVFAIIITIILIIHNKSSIKDKNVSRETFLSAYTQTKILFLSFILLNIGLLVTFSRSAWLAITISYLIILFWIKNSYITFHSFFTSKIFTIIAFLLFIIIITSPLVQNRVDINKMDINNAITDRIFYNSIAYSIISTHPLDGTGMGSFVPEIQNFTTINLAYWQYQPVHNIFLLIFSETGLFGLLIFLIFIHSLFFYKQRKGIIASAFYRILYKMLHVKHSVDSANNSSANKTTYSAFTTMQLLFKLVLFVFLLIGLFDHYLWTLQQGQIVYWTTIGLILATNKKD